MIRVVIKLVVVALAVNALVRVGFAYSRYYRLQDAFQQVAQFSERKNNKEVCDTVLDEAGKLEVPLTAELVIVTRGTAPGYNCGTGVADAAPGSAMMLNKLGISASYAERVAVFPGYLHSFDFKPQASAIIRP